MICRECVALLELYFDGELDQPTSDYVRSHLYACPSCAGKYEKLRREQDFYLGYKCEGATGPLFWDGVFVRVAEEKDARAAVSFAALRPRLYAAFGVLNGPRFSPALMATLLFAAVGLTVGVMKLSDSIRKTSDPVIVSHGVASQLLPSTPPSKADEMHEHEGDDEVGVNVGKAGSRTDQISAVSTNLFERRSRLIPSVSIEATRRSNRKPVSGPYPQTAVLIRDAERKYIAAIAFLSRDASRRPSRLDPETELRFKETLAAVDRTITGTRRAVREHPGDPVAVQYMMTAYAKKVEVLREMVGY
jgi:hypothetical protein